jgi:hypothetical protein
MPKLKVYLSTSKAGASTVEGRAKIALVLTILQTYDVDVVQYDGNPIHADPDLLKCDRLLVVPPGEIDGGEVNVGKGQSHQIMTFRAKNPNQEVWIVNDFILGDVGEEEYPGIFIDEFSEQDINGGSWERDYATLYTNDACINLDNYGLKQTEDYVKRFWQAQGMLDGIPVHSPNDNGEIEKFLNSGTDDPLLACALLIPRSQ